MRILEAKTTVLSRPQVSPCPPSPPHHAQFAFVISHAEKQWLWSQNQYQHDFSRLRDCAKFWMAASLCTSKHFMTVLFLTHSITGFFIERITFSWQASMLICL